MTRSRINLSIVLIAVASLATASANGELTHRWSFNETGGPGTALIDSVGSSNGTIVEGGANNADVGTTTAGQVFMTGGAKGASDYVSLGDNLVSTYTDMTLEFWATTHSSQNWSRIFSLGDGTGNVMHNSWTRGTNLAQTEFRWNNGNNITLQDWGPNNGSFALNQEYHYAVVVDDDGGDGGNTGVRVYVDGVERAAGSTTQDPSSLVNPHFWLGRSQWGDNSANASYNEARVYDSALSAEEVAASFAQGPELVPEPSSFVLGVIALIGAAGFARRRRRRAA